MDFGFDARTEELRERLLGFMDECVYPAEEAFEAQAAESGWAAPPLLDDLKEEARKRGLWNLFLPGEHGAGLTNLQYAPLAEIMGRSPRIAPTATNCAAPDTGNMEVLSMFGDERQRKEWLEPLLRGEIRSAFAMTEPDVASSDATNISLSIVRDGDEYVINGRKWFASGAMNPNCRILIVMGKTAPEAPSHRQQSMVLVPRDTPGWTSGAACTCSATPTPTTAGTPRSTSTTYGCRRPTWSARRAAASRSPRPGSGRAASTTACG
nr:hypothetical protein GCM10020093_053410 [Planobispora longispora]